MQTKMKTNFDPLPKVFAQENAIDKLLKDTSVNGLRQFV